MLSPSCHLSELERRRSESESKDPHDVSSAILMQGVSAKSFGQDFHPRTIPYEAAAMAFPGTLHRKNSLKLHGQGKFLRIFRLPPQRTKNAWSGDPGLVLSSQAPSDSLR